MNQKIVSNIFRNIINGGFVLFFLLIAQNVSAATVTLKLSNPEILVGDTVSVDVIINTEGQNLNVVEGNINISTGLDIVEVKELSSANSALNYWVHNPSWSEKEGIISFIGGTPHGFNSKEVSLFRIFFSTKSVGEVTFSPVQIKAYLNDGFATSVKVKSEPLTLGIKQPENPNVKDEWENIIVQDTQAPEDLVIEFGQDSSLFEGKKFIVISAVDSESGIDYFEVKEGTRSAVRTSNTYVLQNQEVSEPLSIFAFDKAGNVSQKLLNQQSNDQARKSKTNNLIPVYIILGFGFIIILFAVYKIIKSRKKIIK